MFEAIKGFIERVKSILFDEGTIKNVTGESVAVSDAMSSAIRLWSDMYAEGGRLNLPAAIAGEMARLITLELKSEVTGSSRAEFIDKKYSEVIENIRTPVEYGCAKGGLVFKPYVANGELNVDFIHADAFYPLEFNNAGKITAAAFAERITRGDRFYTRIETHKFSGATYTITNKAYVSFSREHIGAPAALSDVSEWSALAESLTVGNVKQPLFGYFKPATANRADPASPLGASVYANAAELIKDADKQYERLLWEFESGERAMIANAMAFKLDKDGKPRLPNRKLYKTLDVEDINFFKEWTPTMREQSFIDGLDRIFRQIEFNCGLAYGTLSDVQTNDKTAEEIRASKQRSYASVCDNQKSLKNALNDLVYAMDVWCTLYNLAPMGKCETSFEFDDSVVADRKSEFAEKQALVTLGIMPAWEFRMWYFGEDEETARARVANELDGVPQL